MATKYKFDSNRIIVSLDGMSVNKSLNIARILKGKVWGFKINDLLYEDLDVIKEFKKYGKIFVDVKLYDIPNTVSNTINRLSKLHIDIITIHSSGGIKMMKAAKSASKKSKIVAVTVLTSKELKYKNEVIDLVKDAIKSKVDGIVLSGHELHSIKDIKGSNKLIKIVPGIRPKSYQVKDDQNRVMSPFEAFKFGADYIVIGRPITQSKNILKTLNDICRE